MKQITITDIDGAKKQVEISYLAFLELRLIGWIRLQQKGLFLYYCKYHGYRVIEQSWFDGLLHCDVCLGECLD